MIKLIPILVIDNKSPGNEIRSGHVSLSDPVPTVWRIPGASLSLTVDIVVFLLANVRHECKFFTLKLYHTRK